MASDASNLIIFHRDMGGLVDYQFPAESLMYACVAEAANISRAMLSHPVAQDALRMIAEDFARAQPNAWHKRVPQFRNDLGYLTRYFTNKILAKFPLLFVDYTMQNPANMGVHWRRPWDGEFEPNRFSITLNGKRVGHMAAAQQKIATGSHITASMQKNIRDFKFIFANVIFHELGHIFLTFLNKGREETPPQMKPRVIGHLGDTEGEVGQTLEQLVFGGVINIARHPHHGTVDTQPGVAYLAINERDIWPIAQDSIRGVVTRDFRFPYNTSQNPHDGASTQGELFSMGHNFPADDTTDPLSMPGMEAWLQGDIASS